MSELISILMPTYNVADYIEDAVTSILKQTYTNFELIIVDDGSTDNTYCLLKKMAAWDTRIQLYRNEKNSKICKTLNCALSHAKGSFIGRMDGDDISEPNRFELLKKHLDEHPNIALVGSSLISIDENGIEFSRKKYPCSSKAIKMGNAFLSSVSHFWLARYEVYETLKGYREVPFVEDYDFLLRGELKGYQYANINAYVYRCRIRTGNTGSTNGLRQKKATEYVKALHKKECQCGRDCFRYEEYCRAIEISENENKKYILAHSQLTKAITLKKRPLCLIRYALCAMLNSKFVAKYVLEAIRFRGLLMIETYIFKGK